MVREYGMPYEEFVSIILKNNMTHVDIYYCGGKINYYHESFTNDPVRRKLSIDKSFFTMTSSTIESSFIVFEDNFLSITDGDTRCIFY